MITIGRTGGIGAGKSLVSEMLATKGAAIVNADLVGHRSYRKGMPAYHLLVAEEAQVLGQPRFPRPAVSLPCAARCLSRCRRSSRHITHR